MTSDNLLVPGLLGLVAVVLVALVVTVVRSGRERSLTRSELARTRAEAAELRDRVEALARTPRAAEPETGSDQPEFVITGIGTEPSEPEAMPPARIEGSLFVDLVVRETVVKAVGLGHGLRRALAPETRNRIRFAMKQEVKRSRKARRIELRDVRRELAARRARSTTDHRVVDPEEGAA